MITYPLPRLRAGDVILLDRQECHVLRVTDCSAVVAVPRPARSFTTTFGKQVSLQPKPALVRISPDSLCPVISRQPHSTKGADQV
jgi:hypothetical protein